MIKAHLRHTRVYWQLFLIKIHLAADIQRERDERIRAESRAANLERQVNVLQLDLKNINQKLNRLEEDYHASQSKVSFR